jgi:hypothetical protein
MSADELKEAALSGRLPDTSVIQAAGQDDWIPATEVKGLAFPEPEPELDESEAEPEKVSQLMHDDLHPRFKTMRDLLNTFLHQPVSINLVNSAHFEEAKLCLACEDHFEITIPGRGVRAFLPYARIKMIATSEVEQDGGQTYSDTHQVTIEVEPCQLGD